MILLTYNTIHPSTKVTGVLALIINVDLNVPINVHDNFLTCLYIKDTYKYIIFYSYLNRKIDIFANFIFC